MCGIAGFIDRKCSDFDSAIRKITTTLKHRGPDAAGYAIDQSLSVALGHRRLSIVDLSPTGAQPMTSRDGRFIVSFNGEIYNFRDLRRELESAGAQFIGSSDTEVMLEAFTQWGVISSIRRFNGMFAFALLDKRDQAFYLVRDRLGVKPLYYTARHERVIFGSELKPILSYPDISKELSSDGIYTYLQRGYITAPYTIYEGIHKLPPGSVLRWDLTHRSLESFESQEYWSPTSFVCGDNTSSGDVGSSIARLKDLLVDSIKIRMVADVPLGAFLSGGIDSSTVVAIMQQLSPKPVKTFSIGFEQNDFNEAKYASEIAAILGTDHSEMYLTPQDAEDIIPKLPYFYDEPFGDPSQIPTYLVSQLARQKVTVSLSGDGGDELFLGYNRYFASNDLWNLLRFIPLSVRQILASNLREISATTWDSLFKKCSFAIPSKYRLSNPGDKIKRLIQKLGADRFRSFYASAIQHWGPEILINSTSFIKDRQYSERIDQFSFMSLFDIESYLPDDILVKLDRASMAHSLEAREPLLDYRIVEFALSLPTSLKYRGGTSKWILRKVLEQYIPPQVFERPKMGFGVPLNSWLRTSLKSWAENLLEPKRLEKQGILKPDIVRHSWDDHISGKANNMYLLWNVLMFQAWLEEANG